MTSIPQEHASSTLSLPPAKAAKTNFSLLKAFEAIKSGVLPKKEPITIQLLDRNAALKQIEEIALFLLGDKKILKTARIFQQYKDFINVSNWLDGTRQTKEILKAHPRDIAHVLKILIRENLAFDECLLKAADSCFPLYLEGWTLDVTMAIKFREALYHYQPTCRVLFILFGEVADFEDDNGMGAKALATALVAMFIEKRREFANLLQWIIENPCRTGNLPIDINSESEV